MENVKKWIKVDCWGMGLKKSKGGKGIWNKEIWKSWDNEINRKRVEGKRKDFN